MINKRLVVVSIALLGLIPSCKHSQYYHTRKQYLKKVFFAGPIPDGPVTIFVHGTKESIISKVVHKLDYPYGIVSATDVEANSVLSRLPRHLHEACPEEFNINNFYFYGWHGKLNFRSRYKAAYRLYNILKKHKGPKTIITHSHGCGVALYLAMCAENDNNPDFYIDRTVFLAPPVQVATKHYVHSPIFREVYSFYSSSDIMQVSDPQGIYWESYAYTSDDTRVPFFSKRTFDPTPNIMQTRILADRQSPGHLLFMLGRFIKHLPCMMSMVKQRAEDGGYEELRNLYIINIPLCNLPLEFLTKKDLKGKYVPRSNYWKARRKARALASC